LLTYRSNRSPSLIVKLKQGDITEWKGDAIVNAANRSLLGGGGVDGAIHKAAGPDLKAYCSELNGCETGDSKSSPGFHLPCRWVIHTVGPIWEGGKNHEESLLKSCYVSALAEAEQLRATSVAFPAISCGIYRFPKEPASRIALESCLQSLHRESSVKELSFILFDDEIFEIYRKLADECSELEMNCP